MVSYCRFDQGYTRDVIIGHMTLFRFPPAVVVAISLGLSAPCAAQTIHQPLIIPHAQWQSRAQLGYAATGMRRNKRTGDSLVFGKLTISVLGMTVHARKGKSANVVRLRLALNNAKEERSARAGAAFNWRGFHLAVIGIYGPGELGEGLVALEIATIASLPPKIASSEIAGGAEMRLRIPQRITHVTLHHTGSEILRPRDNPVEKLRQLQSWGASDRNWWDVPYHYLIDLNGRIYEGRDWHYVGETNTTYDPNGHLLITVIGNYARQEPTPAQLTAIADLMAWALKEFDLPLDRIGGHYNYAPETDCPGRYLRRYLEDGTLRRMVAARLK